MPRRLRASQSIAIGMGLATIFSIAVLWLLLNEAWIPLHSECTTQVTNATAQQTCSWLNTVWSWVLVGFLGITVIGTIATAAFQRRGGR